MNRAAVINLVSGGFAEYFRNRYPDKSLSWFTNGIDDEFVEAARRGIPTGKTKDQITVLYAGNIGEGQCLHQILPQLAKALRDRARFIVIGDGGRRDTLQAAIDEEQINNLEVRAPMSREDLLETYRAADVLFLHLGPYSAFEKVLPSKIFEYGALGKPILAGVAGYSARFIHEELSNAAVFAPCDVTGAVAAFESLRLEDGARAEFVSKYARANIASNMADEILTLASGNER